MRWFQRAHSLPLNGYTFTFKLPTLLLIVIAMYGLSSLGLWQLHRADEKRALLAEYQTRLTAPVLPIAAVVQNPQAFVARRVQGMGVFDSKQQFLLDNRIVQHQAGFDVITPVRLPGYKALLLVNRGFIPARARHGSVPELPVSKGMRRFSGRLYLPISSVFTLAEESENTWEWPLIIQKIDIKQISQHLKQPVLPFLIRLAEASPQAFAYHWKPVTMKPAKHVGYAVQWFALAVVLGIAYIVSQTKRNEAMND